MSITIKGVIHAIEAPRTIKDKVYQSFIVKTEEKYPQFIKLEASQDIQAKLNELSGKQVECSINLRGREWDKMGEKVYFNSLDCWRIKEVEQGF